MSIYSGFATRSLETSYNKCLGEILYLCQSHLLVYLQKGKKHIDSSDKSSFLRNFIRLFNNLKTLEQQKHLKPMFSVYCTELADFLKQCNEYSYDLPTIQDSTMQSTFSNDLDFQILNDGLAYDDTRVQRFTPSRLETVLEKPRSKHFSREKTHKMIHSKNSPPDMHMLKFKPVFKKNKNSLNQIIYNQNRALNRIHNEISFL
ncbi:hypothetical protein SteCoe_13723 [Stentor coeruleus]|uniref:Uncharacterized protein n=1 Tax=Stentor coeruleus TaxID=5963 RepID=A0A1R2C7T3_9CILI|nr:hypothetical protein SteCoe_13723 [Stentor coeruleus]